jgi:hypothetical protein
MSCGKYYSAWEDHADYLLRSKRFSKDRPGTIPIINPFILTQNPFNMAIRTIQKRPIALKAALTNGLTLAVPAYAQEQSNWCWDACYQMVFAFFKFTITQCSIAQQVPWNTYGNCCGKPNCCNQAASDINITKGWTKWGYSCAYTASYISYATIQAAINSSYVVEAGLSWTSGGGHVVLVIGYVTSNTDNYLHVNDPGSAQTALVKYSYLKSAYGAGAWDATWNNITSTTS